MISRWRWTVSGLHWQFFRLLPLRVQQGSRGPLLRVCSGTFLTKNILFQVVREENYRISNIWGDLHCFHNVCVCVSQPRSALPSGRLAGEDMKKFKMLNRDSSCVCLCVSTVSKWSDVAKEIRRNKNTKVDSWSSSVFPYAYDRLDGINRSTYRLMEEDQRQQCLHVHVTHSNPHRPFKCCPCFQ